MRSFSLRFIRPVVLIIAPLVATGSLAHADPLTTFTLTDLGAGTPTFATDAGGNGIVIAGNGQTAYAFQTAQDTSLTEKQLLLSQFPLVDAAPPASAPGAYGDSANVYSVPLTATTNGQGSYVAIDSDGVYGHVGSADVYAVTQNANGTWSAPQFLWTGGDQYTGGPNAAAASIVGINRLNEVLGAGLDGTSSGLSQAYLYNMNTDSLLNLSTLNVLLSGGWSNLQPIAIDNQGRILLEASPNPATGEPAEQTLLLTPQGVSSSPLEMAAPEPGALALAVVTIGALALRRAVWSRA